MGMTRDKMEFAAALALHLPSLPERTINPTSAVSFAERIMHLGTSYKRFAEAHCNRELTPAEQRKWLHIANRIAKLCSEWGIQPRIQNDPRGCTVKLVVPSGYTNDWGKEGICVPTA